MWLGCGEVGVKLWTGSGETMIAFAGTCWQTNSGFGGMMVGLCGFCGARWAWGDLPILGTVGAYLDSGVRFVCPLPFEPFAL